ncbi:MAG: hypothetical protein BGO49_18770 [Planctomycetales bacterium 71-10]|nr:MAG: hypothetical protein BGO49_18770 [Planctomycetales bacterium 71-10]
MAEAGSTSQEPYRFRIGSYGILHPLGSGGMSSVFRAVHVETGHEVALKVLPTAMARNTTILKRFVAEVRSAADLQHPNIVQIYDRGSDDGRFYLVLEYVPGGDLHEYVQHRGPLDAEEAVGLIIQVARGLEYAASRGVIHRDVKPSNVLRTPEGEAKIIDLGLALRPEAEDERVTREGTTVGTVDYMAPEQARDSRATSFQSDIYSLGCTLHYLLTGLPPYPGGDITEKLTRHARNPPPDVLAARPDLPPALGAVLRRMMAKKPEDRQASYRELLSELGAIVGDESSVALVPIDEEVGGGRPARDRASLAAAVAVAAGPESRNSSLPEISLAALADDLLDEDEPVGPPRAAGLGGPGPAGVATPVPLPHPVSLRQPDGVSEDAWIWRCVIIGAVVIVGVIGLDLILRPFPNNNAPLSVGEPSRAAQPPRPVEATAPAAIEREPVRRPPPPARAASPSGGAPAWVEPADAPAAVAPAKSYPPGVLSAYLPPWATAPVPLEADGPRTVVRRAPDARDAGAVSSLRQALDVPRGVVEIADVGPFPIGDLRIPGEARIIRSRPGYRAVVRIEGGRVEAARSLPGVFNLDGRSLVLDSLDLVVNVRDLGLNQKALFHVAGGELTLRNCTVTIYNPMRSPFAFVRTEAGAIRPLSRIRIEDSLIRGDVSPLFEMGPGAAEAVAFRSFLASDGPIVRTPDASPQPRHSLHALGSVLACRGPLVDLTGGPKADAGARRLTVRAYDSAFGRIGGPGVASLVHSDTAAAVLGHQLDWSGAENLFVGWLGYYSAGPEHEIRSRTLAAFRSTWNEEATGSREIATEWPATSWIADLAPPALRPFLPGWEGLVDGVARPRPHLKARTLFGFPAPVAPTIAHAGGGPRGVGELTFDVDAVGPWNGDLGAFLRDNASDPGGRVWVRVIGSGTRPISPVRLGRGASVEIRVEQPPPPADKPGEVGRPPLTFAPAAGAAGSALLALDGGSLSISGLRLRAEGPSSLESLIRVEDGSLALNRCELSIPQSPGPPPVLVTFVAATTRPRPSPPPDPPLVGPMDRPACVLEDCLLATVGDALHAEVGMGVVSLSRCAVGARGDVFALTPARVARSRFFADLRLDRCTIATAGAAVRVDAWPGEAPGPDRPWLVSSSDTAYVDLSERTPRESVLCRADAEAFAQGQVFWRQDRDAIELQAFAAGGDAPLPNRNRDVAAQWVDLWGADHIREVTGPRTGSAAPSVRLLGRPRPGRVEPLDLQLDANHLAVRPRLDVGADPAVFDILGRQGRRR